MAARRFALVMPGGMNNRRHRRQITRGNFGGFADCGWLTARIVASTPLNTQTRFIGLHCERLLRPAVVC
jgi:hypothetical protein